MLGVLLATAKPGQRRPLIRDALDLLRGALVIRARRPWCQAKGAWDDGLAIVSLLGPVLLSVFAVVVGPQDGYNRVSSSGEIVRVYPWFVWVGWPLVLAALLGWRRPAVAAGPGAERPCGGPRRSRGSSCRTRCGRTEGP